MGLENRGHTRWDCLFLSPFMPKRGHPVPTKALSTTKSRCGHGVCTLRVHPHFLPFSSSGTYLQRTLLDKGHCWKWQNEAEHMETLCRKGLNAIARMCLWCHFQQFPWEIGSVWAERVGQREVIWYTQKVNTAWLCLDLAVNFPQQGHYSYFKHKWT